MKDNLIERVLKTIRSYAMIRPGDSVLVAVSGGPDSIFLLRALHRLLKKCCMGSLSVCNLDHGLRGKESSDDSLFVSQVTERLGLPLYHKKVRISQQLHRGLSTEEVAREVRYRFFAEAAAQAGATVVATGHTLDDQAETVMMRIVKGSSLKGLVGIAPVRSESELRVIRPLAEIERADILRYLDAAGISYRTDSSNLTGIYFRNVVRSEILPFLQRYNPKIKRSLFSMAEHLREDFEFIREEKARVTRGISRSGSGSVEISLKDIVTQPRAIQKEVLRDCLDRCGGDVKKLTFRHWKDAESIITMKGKGARVDLPGSIRITRTDKTIIFNKI